MHISSDEIEIQLNPLLGECYIHLSSMVAIGTYINNLWNRNVSEEIMIHNLCCFIFSLEKLSFQFYFIYFMCWNVFSLYMTQLIFISDLILPKFIAKTNYYHPLWGKAKSFFYHVKPGILFYNHQNFFFFLNMDISVKND